MNKVTRFGIYFFSICIFISLGWWGNDYYNSKLTSYPDPISIIKQKPLEKYQIENLTNALAPSVQINIKDNLFDFTFDPTFSGKKEKKVTGLINIPEGEGPFPLIILIRGYIDQSIYQTGMGTKKVGEFFSKNGYITIAPDFLGYGGSDAETENIFEARFQTYTTVLTLLKSIKSPVNANALAEAGWDGKNIFIWAHSNGGQIALTTLEVLGESNPDLIKATVLWAPVTESFPYTVLYYTNESEDKGKLIRKELAKFEEDYDVEKFSLTNYLDKINAPIEYHYGANDDAIPIEWRNKFVKQMKDLDNDFTNYNHSGADHNMNPLWSEVIQKTFQFFENKRI